MWSGPLWSLWNGSSRRAPIWTTVVRIFVITKIGYLRHQIGGKSETNRSRSDDLSVLLPPPAALDLDYAQGVVLLELAADGLDTAPPSKGRQSCISCVNRPFFPEQELVKDRYQPETHPVGVQ